MKSGILSEIWQIGEVAIDRWFLGSKVMLRLAKKTAKKHKIRMDSVKQVTKFYDYRK